MDKPILTYDVRQQENRASGGVMFIPSIVDRNDALPLDEVIVRAIKQGRIVGLKESAASAIADAIARQMYEEFKEGNGVRFGNYFYARVYLKGTTDGNGTPHARRKHERDKQSQQLPGSDQSSWRGWRWHECREPHDRAEHPRG